MVRGLGGPEPPYPATPVSRLVGVPMATSPFPTSAAKPTWSRNQYDNALLPRSDPPTYRDRVVFRRIGTASRFGRYVNGLIGQDGAWTPKGVCTRYVPLRAHGAHENPTAGAAGSCPAADGQRFFIFGADGGGSLGAAERGSLIACASFWRQESASMSTMWQRWTKRSISADTQAAPGKTVLHCLKGKFVVSTSERASCLRLMML